MPATDQIWRPLGTMHRVFAASAIALFASTIVMMVFDQDREWRRTQAVAEDIQFEAARHARENLATAEFRDEQARLEGVITAAKEAAEAQAGERAKLQEELTPLNGQVELLERRVKAQNGIVNVARANRDILVRDAAPEAELAAAQKTFEEELAKADALTLELQAVKAKRDAVRSELDSITEAVKEAEAELEKFEEEYQRLTEQMQLLRPAQAGSGLGGWFAGTKRQVKRWAIVNGFNPEISIVQDWLPDLKQQLGMARVARFDRCRTCHVNIDKFESGGIPTFPHGHPETDDVAEWVEQGAFPHPFSSHPRPDVYLTATSPHGLEKFGCTICHDGDGSGTSFQTAEHTPTNPAIAEEWSEEHHWHSNHFWEYPMQPSRFIESTCLKCHHSVIELGVNDQFGPTAPKVFEGYELISEYGCFGCHEINGYDGARPIGPDLRLEPQTVAEAEAIAADPNQVAGRMRKVGPSLRHIAAKTTPEFVSYWTEDPQRFRPDTRMPKFFHLTNQTDHQAELLQPVELAGLAAFLMARSEPLDLLQPEEGYEPDAQRGKHEFSRRCLACHSHDDPDFAERRPDFGPNLTRVHEKIRSGEEGFNWLYTWVRDPERHHERTRMPYQFLDPAGDGIDIAADITEFLLTGGPREFPAQPVGGPHLGLVLETITAEGGEGVVVRIVEVVQSAPASRPVAIVDEEARQAPPLPLLQPGDIILSLNGVTLTHAEQVDSLIADAALGSKVALAIRRGNQEYGVELTVSDPLEDLTRLFLRKQLTEEELEATLERGVLLRRRGTVGPDGEITFNFEPVPAKDIKGDEIELVHQDDDPESLNPAVRRERMLQYVGRRTISRYGCFGCHDIPGYETARPIGTALQDWGRKETSKLAPEHIEEWLHHHGEPDGSSTYDRVDQAITDLESGDPVTEEDEAATFFYESLVHHGRPGFFWQKLRQPRSYDYEKTETKGWDERLRMPKFPFSESQIESIATFVLGLVADPPPSNYLYQPEGPAADRIEGERLLAKYNCASCHIIDLPGFKYETDLRDLVGITRTELVEWFEANAQAIVDGEITQATIAGRPDADGAAQNTELIQPPEYRRALATFIANSEQLLVGEFDEVADLTTDLAPFLAQLVLDEEAEGLNDWLDTYPAVLLADPIPAADAPESVWLAIGLKPPVSHGAQIEHITGPETIEVHGLVYAAPDPEEEDPDFREYAFDMWENSEIGGRYKVTGISSRLVFGESTVSEILPGRGGDFAQWLVPRVTENETAGDRNKAWQASPPPLYREGVKVQTPWLYRFLKNPEQLRYTTVLRMPRFNMSDEEAQSLANYFAARDGAPYPYQQIPQRQADYLAEKNAAHAEAYPEAENDYLTTSWYTLNAPLCVKCHSVGGRPFKAVDPMKDIRGPNLERVAQRLRPDWVKLWLFKPAAITPYTSMPSNFPVNQSQFPELFGGDAELQTEGVVDALMNYYELLEAHGVTAYEPPMAETPAPEEAAQ